MGLCHSEAFLTATIEASASRPTLKLTWLTKKPIWVDQRPLSTEKLAHLQELVDEQVKLGHLVLGILLCLPFRKSLENGDSYKT